MNSNGNWLVEIRGQVNKALIKFPVKDQRRLEAALEILSRNPYAGDIEKMKGENNIWRRRVGDYRIFYEVYPNQRSVYVFHVERRTSKTY